MNITIGQYYPVTSFLHSLDPRTKILSTLLYMTAVFCAKNIYGYILSIIFLLIVIFISNVPINLIISGLKNIIIIILFTVILNMLFIKDGNEILNIGFIHITNIGIITAVKLCTRLILLILGSSMLTLVTTPIDLTAGIEALLRPFKRIGLPSHEIAMMMSIALRFIPTLLEELDKIKKAQMARGIDFDSGGLIQKAKSMVPLLVPLFISAFRRADELAMAMEARCYRGDINRTKMNELKYQGIDYIALITTILFTFIVIMLRIV